MHIFAGERADRAEVKILPCADNPRLFDEEAEGVRETGAELLARHRAAIALCRACPVVWPCYTAALAEPESAQYGIRAGLTAWQRRMEIRRRRRQAEAAAAEQAQRGVLAPTGGAR